MLNTNTSEEKHREYGIVCKAFTLAEVLITLGIIGIVAALTIPNLIVGYKEKVFINKLKSTYSLLNQAFKQAADDYGEVDTWGATREERRDASSEILSKYLKIVKECDNLSLNCIYGGAYTSRIRNINSKTTIISSSRNKSFVLANGVSVILGASDPENCSQTLQEYNAAMSDKKESWYNACFDIYVDLNGKAKPNAASEDLFLFYVMKDGIVPAGTSGSNNWSWVVSFKNQCLGEAPYGALFQANCTAWVLANENMDYLHCPDKIGWDKAKNCKDSQ